MDTRAPEGIREGHRGQASAMAATQHTDAVIQGAAFTGSIDMDSVFDSLPQFAHEGLLQDKRLMRK